jgi:hypothetical protein
MKGSWFILFPFFYPDFNLSRHLLIDLYALEHGNGWRVLTTKKKS